MRGFIATVVGTAVALWVTSIVYDGISFGPNPQVTTVVIVAAIFGVVNGVIKPVIKLLSLPLTVMTFGLFGLIVNGALLLLLAWVSQRLDMTFTVGGYPPDFGLDAIVAAVVAGIVLSVVSTVIGFLPFLNPSH